MGIGAFSVSLSVKNINDSKVFYENLGFKVFGGDINEKWLIMKNDDCVIGIFQDMFEKNMMTFNPGWDSNANEIKAFKNISILYNEFKNAGVSFIKDLDTADGGKNFIISDPDGNIILFDQHI